MKFQHHENHNDHDYHHIHNQPGPRLSRENWVEGEELQLLQCCDEDYCYYCASCLDHYNYNHFCNAAMKIEDDCHFELL